MATWTCRGSQADGFGAEEEEPMSRVHCQAEEDGVLEQDSAARVHRELHVDDDHDESCVPFRFPHQVWALGW